MTFSRDPHSRSFWLRIGGYGPGISVLSPEMPVLFSERNGYRKPLVRISGWRVFWLPIVPSGLL